MKVNHRNVRWIISLMILMFFTFFPSEKVMAKDITDEMEGKIGKYKIVMQLDIYDNGKVNGWYYYKSKGPGKKISLSGNYNSKTDQINLTEKVNGKITGYFRGEYVTGHLTHFGWLYQYNGIWESPSGKKLEFLVTNAD